MESICLNVADLHLSEASKLSVTYLFATTLFESSPPRRRDIALNRSCRFTPFWISASDLGAPR